MMEYPSKRQRLSRIQRRTFARPGQFQDNHKDLRNDRATIPSTLIPRSVEELREPLLVREKRGGPKRLDDKHRMLHHRQAVVTKEDTVVVSVVAKVDSNGSTIALQTLPSVPTVPPFPSDLTVPAVPQVSSVSLPVVPSYPFGTGATITGSLQPTATGSQPLSFLPTTTAANLPTGNSSLSITSSAQATDVSAAAISNNSTLSSTGSIPSLSAVSSISSNSSIALLSTLSSTSPSSRSTTLKNTASSAGSATASSGNGGGGGALGTAASSRASSSPTGLASSGSGGNAGPGPSTSTVVGGVFGGLAGIALILALALLLLRWYKQKNRSAAMHRLDEQRTEDDPFADPPTQRAVPGPPEPSGPLPSSPRSMSQRRSFFPAGAAGFLNRFSSGSKESDYSSGLGSPTQERGFQKISGRKLPSAFSEGMTEADVQGRRSMLSDTSFYRNSQGIPSVSGVDVAGPSAATLEKETLMPSPARTPVVHQPFTLSATPPPRPGTQDSFVHPNMRPGTLGRSLPSHDGSRGSRFTEEVV